MPSTRDLDTFHRERRATVEAFNRTRLGLGEPDCKASALKRQLRRITRQYERSLAGRRFLRKFVRVAGTLLILLAILAMPVALVAYLLDWPLMTTARHLLAWPNCGAAREVGLAPALRGAPGYWKHHDADKDGISCEPWPKWRR